MSVSKLFVVPLVTKSGIRKYAIRQKDFNKRYLYNPKKRAYRKKSLLSAIYRYVLIPVGDDFDTQGYERDDVITAWDKLDNIGVIAHKDLLRRFRENNLFPLSDAKAGAFKGGESITYLAPFIYTRGKSYSRHVVRQWSKEWGGGL